MGIALVSTGLLSLLKIFLWVLLAIFIVFCGVVVRQVQLMRRVLTVPVAGGLLFVALGFLAFAIGIFIISLVAL